MSRLSVDSGAYRLAINIMLRAADRHGEPTIAEAAHELRKTASIMDVKIQNELLEALEEMLHSFMCTQNPNDYPSDAPCNKARAAIAKAKG